MGYLPWRPSQRIAAEWQRDRAARGLSRALLLGMALYARFVNNVWFAHNPIATAQETMESAIRGSNLAYTPGMNALAGRLRTMNGAWLEDRLGNSVRLLRANIPDAEPHFEGFRNSTGIG